MYAPSHWLEYHEGEGERKAQGSSPFVNMQVMLQDTGKRVSTIEIQTTDNGIVKMVGEIRE